MERRDVQDLQEIRGSSAAALLAKDAKDDGMGSEHWCPSGAVGKLTSLRPSSLSLELLHADTADGRALQPFITAKQGKA